MIQSPKAWSRCARLGTSESGALDGAGGCGNAEGASRGQTWAVPTLAPSSWPGVWIRNDLAVSSSGRSLVDREGRSEICSGTGASVGTMGVFLFP